MQWDYLGRPRGNSTGDAATASPCVADRVAVRRPTRIAMLRSFFRQKSAWAHQFGKSMDLFVFIVFEFNFRFFFCIFQGYHLDTFSLDEHSQNTGGSKPLFLASAWCGQQPREIHRNFPFQPVWPYQWIGFLGKIFTGNPWVFTIEYRGFRLKFSHHPIL